MFFDRLFAGQNTQQAALVIGVISFEIKIVDNTSFEVFMEWKVRVNEQDLKHAYFCSPFL